MVTTTALKEFVDLFGMDEAFQHFDINEIDDIELKIICQVMHNSKLALKERLDKISVK